MGITLFCAELETQLTAAETRSQLLENQLDYMRKMVQTAESDRQEAVIKAAVSDRVDRVTQSPPQPGPSPEYLRQREKLMDLEREHLRLTASQTLSEVRIMKCCLSKDENWKQGQTLNKQFLIMKLRIKELRIIMISGLGVDNTLVVHIE